MYILFDLSNVNIYSYIQALLCVHALFLTVYRQTMCLDCITVSTQHLAALIYLGFTGKTFTESPLIIPLIKRKVKSQHAKSKPFFSVLLNPSAVSMATIVSRTQNQ